jgi:hypothetical protein
VTSWPVDLSTGLAFGESIVTSPYMVRYFPDHILGLNRFNKPIADCATTEELIWIGF